MIIPGKSPVLKRLPVSVDSTEGVQRYDRDNRYPQRAKEVMYRSYTLNGIVNRYANFINGDGFVDPLLNDIVVSEGRYQQVTLRKLLDQIAFDKAWIKGFALHVNYNANFTISSITQIPFEYCRMEGDEDGEEDEPVNSIKYSTNWEQDYYKQRRKRVVIEYDRFNPNPEFLAQKFAECGGPMEYKGQIYYWTPDVDQYPKASFDPVFELAEAQYEINLFTLNNIVNGFTAGHIMMYPGKFEDDTEAFAFKKRLQEHKGANGANSIMVIEAGTSDIKGSDFLVKTEVSNNDKLFEFTTSQIEKALLQNYGMPYEIIGKLPESGLFNRQNIEEAYYYYNAVTSDERKQVSQALSEIFRYWWQPIDASFEIVPQQYVKGAQPTSGTPAAPGQPEPQPAQTNEVLRNMSGKQNIAFQRYLRDFTNGKNNYQMTKTLLQSAFGFSDNEIVTILGEPEIIANA